MTKEELHYVRTKRYKDIRKAKGWITVSRLVPPDLAKALELLIVKHRAEHFDVWDDIKIKARAQEPKAK